MVNSLVKRILHEFKAGLQKVFIKSSREGQMLTLQLVSAFKMNKGRRRRRRSFFDVISTDRLKCKLLFKHSLCIVGPVLTYL